MIEEYCTIKEAAKLMGVTRVTLRRWEKAGKIKPPIRHPINKRRMYKRADLNFLIVNDHQHAIITRLLVLWKKNPELRLGQLLWNKTKDRDYFYDSDEDFLRWLEKDLILKIDKKEQ